jgi:tetratricopeptide (TPR) repeat protein
MDISVVLRDRQAAAAKLKLEGLSPPQQALLQASTGLILTAEKTLTSMPDPGREALMVLGDLYLRQGLTGQARETYAAAARQAPDPAISPAALPTRLGLCDWVEGRFASALRQFAAAEAADASDLPCRLYHALLLEVIGQYDMAAGNLNFYRPPEGYSPPLEALQAAGQLADRLTALGFPCHRPGED